MRNITSLRVCKSFNSKWYQSPCLIVCNFMGLVIYIYINNHLGPRATMTYKDPPLPPLLLLAFLFWQTSLSLSLSLLVGWVVVCFWLEEHRVVWVLAVACPVWVWISAFGFKNEPREVSTLLSGKHRVRNSSRITLVV